MQVRRLKRAREPEGRMGKRHLADRPVRFGSPAWRREEKQRQSCPVLTRRIAAAAPEEKKEPGGRPVADRWMKHEKAAKNADEYGIGPGAGEWDPGV